ncbi:MAG TPA: serine hydrolase [Ktedonobacteraceae bacterium]|nr:serine hydrolase [Ktedonobacteraceae bacterium]
MTVQQSVEQQQLADLEEFVPSVMQKTKVPGLALAVIKGDQVILARGFGKRNLAEDLEVTAHTLFAIGSSSKAFTAMGLAMLVDEGKLEWDKPVRHYIPSFKLYDHVATGRLTPRDLLIHDSGLPRYDILWYNNANLLRKDVVERLQYLEPTHDFRTAWQYQNLMYTTAGYLIEVISGQTWEEFTRRRILEPLGMSSTNFSVHDSQQTSDFALPYKETKEQIERIDFYDRFQAIGPAGSINSHIMDMAKWVICLLNKGKYGDGKKRLLSEAQFNQLVMPQIITPDLPTLFTKYEELFHWTYAHGWFVSSYRGHTMLQHGGNIDGFSALVTFLPDDQLGIVTLTNLDSNFATEIVTFSLCDRLFGLSDVPWLDRYQTKFAELKEQAEKSKQANAEGRIPSAPLTHPLSAYAGEFEHPAYGTFTIAQNGNSLKGYYNDLEYTFTHLHYDVFVVEQERFEISCKGSFAMNLKGDIESFSIALGLEPGMKPFVFTRAADKSMQEKGFLEQFVGDYEVMGMMMTIALRGEQALSATLPGQPTYELEPYKATEFRIKGQPEVSIEFRHNEAGQVVEAVLNQPQGILIARKKNQG